jgi:hypothetical protein
MCRLNRYYVARCGRDGWVALVVGCQLGFQLGYPATPDTRGIRSKGSPASIPQAMIRSANGDLRSDGTLPELGWPSSRRAALVTGIYVDRAVAEGLDHPVWVTGVAGIDWVWSP